MKQGARVDSWACLLLAVVLLGIHGFRIAQPADTFWKTGGIPQRWDGDSYLAITKDLPNQIGNISQYYSQRILPGAVTYGILRLAGAELSTGNVMAIYQWLNLIIMAASLWLAWRILQRFQMPEGVRFVLLLILFCNQLWLRLLPFYIYLTDGAAFLVGLGLLYGAIRRRRGEVFAWTLAGSFIWPLALPTGLALLLLPYAPPRVPMQRQLSRRWRALLAGLTGAAFYLTVVLLCFKGSEPPNFTIFPRIPEVFWYAIPAAVFVGGLAFLALRLAPGWLYGLIQHRASWQRGIWAAVLIIIVFSIKHLLSNANMGNQATLKSFILSILMTGSAYPAVGVISAVSFWGPWVLLLVFGVKKYMPLLRAQDIGLQGIWLGSMALLLLPEARFNAFTLPFLWFPLVRAAHTVALSRWRLVAFSVASLLVSRPWKPVSLPGQQWTPGNLYGSYMQRYFEMCGAWWSEQSFLREMIIAGLCLAFVWLVFRRQMHVLPGAQPAA